MEANRKNKILLELFNKKELDIPSPSTLHNIAMNIDNNELEEIFRKFFDKHVTKKNIAVDGKWLNGSGVSGQYINEDKKIMFNIIDKDTKLNIGHKLIGKVESLSMKISKKDGCHRTLHFLSKEKYMKNLEYLIQILKYQQTITSCSKSSQAER